MIWIFILVFGSRYQNFIALMHSSLDLGLLATAAVAGRGLWSSTNMSYDICMAEGKPLKFVHVEGGRGFKRYVQVYSNHR